MILLNQLNNLKIKNINFNNFKIDVGTAIDAPHSAHWLNNENDVFVLAIEPNDKNVSILKEGSFRYPDFLHLRINDKTILKNTKIIKTFKDEDFFLLEKVAIDNVSSIKNMDFYCTDDRNTGCSSLLLPTEILGLDIEKIDVVEVISLEFILDYIGFPENTPIKFVKTDAQGKDFDVIKSLGKYLKNVVAMKCEYKTSGQYTNSNSESDFLNYMISNGFDLYKDNGYDYFFINKTFSLTENTFNLPNI